ncbi:MAG: Zn-dependent protease with chaperone function [Motiliproteus sp.]|jgi:Zn-dependent protease with chaperone function
MLTSLLLVLLPGCASQAGLWMADSIVSAGSGDDNKDSQRVTLKRPDNGIAGSVDRASIKALAEVTARINQAAGIQTTLYITDRGSPGPNAYAARVGPDYIIAVNLQMLTLIGTDKNMYAALIGHEVAHCLKRHDIVGENKGFSETMASTASRIDQETEADEVGIQLMKTAGYPLTGALTFYTKLTTETGNNLPAFFRQHPSNIERLENIQRATGHSL